MGGDGRRHLSLPVVVAQARRTGNALSARLRTARLSLPAVLLLAAATFFLGRASGAGKVHLVRPRRRRPRRTHVASRAPPSRTA